MKGRQRREFTRDPDLQGRGMEICNYKANFCLPGTPGGIGIRTTHPGPPKSASGRSELPSEAKDHPQQYCQWSFVFSALQELHHHQSGEPWELTEGNSSCVRVFYTRTALSLVFYMHLTQAHVHKRKPRLRGVTSPTQMTRKQQGQA